MSAERSLESSRSGKAGSPVVVVHRLLLSASVTLLAFALSPDPQRRYREAASELRQILALQSDPLDEQVEQWALQAYSDISATIRGSTIFPEPTFRSEDGRTLSVSDDLRRSEIGLPRVLYAKPLDPDASLLELRSHLLRLSVFLLVPSKEEMATRLNFWQPDGCRPCTLVGMSVDTSSTGGYWVVRGAYGGRGGNDSASVSIFDADTLLYSEWRPSGREWLYSVVRSAASLGASWAEEAWRTPILVENPYRDDGLFPRLQKVWSEVADLRPREALATVEARAAQEGSSLHFLGVSVDERVVLFVGVPGIALLLLGLIAFLVDLRTKLELYEYPVGLLFVENQLGQGLALLSTALLPTGAVFLLLMRVAGGAPASLLWLLVDLVLILVIFGLGSIVLIEAEKIRAMVNAINSSESKIIVH